MSGLKVGVLITGIRQYRFQRLLMDREVRARVRDAVGVTTEAVAVRARALVPVSDARDHKAKNRPGPGELRDTIRTSYTTNGTMGFVLAGFGKLVRRRRALKHTVPRTEKAMLLAQRRHIAREAAKATREKGVYAMVVNYGSPHRGIPGVRFMDRAREAERAAHIARIKVALQRAASAVKSRQLPRAA